MHSRLILSGLAACALAAPTLAQTISAIPQLTVPHSILDVDDVGPAGPTALLALRLAGSPCSVGLANLSFASASVTTDAYNLYTTRGRGLGWNGTGLALIDANGAFHSGDLRIDLSTPCTEIGFGLGDYSGSLILDFYRGANLLSTFSTSAFNGAPLQRFRMSGNTFDRVELRRVGADGFVITDLLIESGIEVAEMPFFPGLHSAIDMDTVGTAGPTNLAALNAAGSPMPANLRDVVLTANGQPLSVYDVNTAQGRALARNANNQIALVNPPSGVYQPFNARFDVARASAFGISIGDWQGAFALEFYDGNTLLETVITGNTLSPSPRYFYMTGATFDRVDVHALDPNARWVIPAIYVQTGSNDCCDAIPVSAGTSASYDTRGASTSQPAWPCGAAGNDIWFRYVAPCSGNARFETCGLASFDTVMQVFTGPCSNLSALACNDDACTSNGSRIDLAVEMGRAYLVRIGGFSSASGSVALRITETPSANGSFFGIGSNCGNVGLQASGIPALGGSVQYSMTNVGGVPFLFLGLSEINFPLCAAGCVLRVLPDLASLQTGAIQAAIPCDPLLVGAVFYVQGIDYGGTFGCSAGSPAQLSVTQLIRTTIG
jgi:hypothetical protein